MKESAVAIIDNGPEAHSLKTFLDQAIEEYERMINFLIEFEISLNDEFSLGLIEESIS